MKKARKKRGVSWFAIALCAIIAYFSVILVTQQVRLHQIRVEQADAEARLSAANEAHARLVEEKENLQRLDYIEKIAREELGMTRAGELPYRTGRR